jgi:excisionase family DNA binding protein
LTTTKENEMTHPQPSDAHPEQRPPVPSDLLNITEAAEHLGTPVRFIRRLIAERRIPFYKIGRYVRIDPADLDRFIQEGRVERKREWTQLHESA